jgi:hypothetical protein
MKPLNPLFVRALLVSGSALVFSLFGTGCTSAAFASRAVTISATAMPGIDPVRSDGAADESERTFHMEVSDMRALQLISPEHEILRAALEKAGYVEVPQGRARYLIFVRADVGVPGYDDMGPVVEKEGFAAMSAEDRLTSVYGMLPNRHQDAFADGPVDNPEFLLGPEGEVIVAGVGRSAADVGSDRPARTKVYRSYLVLEARDLSAPMPEASPPVWTVVMVSESDDAAKPVTLRELVDFVGDYVGRTTTKEVRIALDSKPAGKAQQPQ